MKWTSRPLHSFWAKPWRKNVYRDIPEEMRSMIEPIVADHGLELVDVERHQGRPPWTLRVIVDNPNGDGRVPIERCADVSREIGAHLDATDAIPVRYQLEVSSPGLDRVLAREKDFARSCGREIRLETRAPHDGRRRFRGRLLAFEAGVARLSVDGSEVAIRFDDVARARAVYEFTRDDFARRTGGSGR
jgi:ribosome maturation factor RimP